MEDKTLNQKSPWIDFLPVIGLGFTAIFWTFDGYMYEKTGGSLLAFLPAKRFLFMFFAAAWLLTGGLYALRVVRQKVEYEKALLLGGVFGMLAGEIMCFIKLASFWKGKVEEVLPDFDPSNPLDIGGALWNEQLVMIGIVFAGVGLGLFSIGLFPQLMRRKRRKLS
ncbi:MAG: hypothetical protein H6581_09175 [Bacteroidia bacterium]|nr:hypothetical protein [Bacteroidia bacterium]